MLKAVPFMGGHVHPCLGSAVYDSSKYTSHHAPSLCDTRAMHAINLVETWDQAVKDARRW